MPMGELLESYMLQLPNWKSGSLQGSLSSPAINLSCLSRRPSSVGMPSSLAEPVYRSLCSPTLPPPLPHALESSTCPSLNVIVCIQPRRADVRKLTVTSERILDKSPCGKRKLIAGLGPTLETFGS